MAATTVSKERSAATLLVLTNALIHVRKVSVKQPTARVLVITHYSDEDFLQFGHSITSFVTKCQSVSVHKAM